MMLTRKNKNIEKLIKENELITLKFLKPSEISYAITFMQLCIYDNLIIFFILLDYNYNIVISHNIITRF